jgi:peptidoglycan/LPS O-acetylase OafA/YrhL
MLAHSALTWSLTPSAESVGRLFAWLASVGRFGVDLFFVLSAFLITRILLDVRDRDGSVRGFYLRRMLRIAPLYYVVLLTLALWQAPGKIGGEEIWYALNLSNWRMALNGRFGDNGYGVFWSLAVEEQFYAIWPLLVLALAPKRLALLGFCGIAVALLWRGALVLMGSGATTVVTATPSQLDALGAGVVLAVLARRATLVTLLKPARFVLVLSGLALLAIGVSRGGFGGDDLVAETVGQTLFVLAFGALLLLALAGSTRSIVRRVFETRWLGVFGRYSFCLYLVHAPVGETIRLIAYSDAGLWLILAPLGIAAHFLIWSAIVGCSLAIAWLSWRYFEGPLLSLGRGSLAPRPAAPIGEISTSNSSA